MDDDSDTMTDEIEVKVNSRKRHANSEALNKMKEQMRTYQYTTSLSSKELTETVEKDCESLNCKGIKTCGIKRHTLCRDGIKIEQTKANISTINRLRTIYHISETEHVCGKCIDDALKMDIGIQCEDYANWRIRWVKNSRRPPSARTFIQEEVLPFWLECNSCSKWRPSSQISLEPEDVLSFTCHDCNEPEDPNVQISTQNEFINSFTVFPLIHNSPASHYLMSEYFYDEVNMSPNNTTKIYTSNTSHFIRPFHLPDKNLIAFTFLPDTMEIDELNEFVEFQKEQTPYLGIRNLIIALWSMDPYNYLTLQKCQSYLICRGMGRIWYKKHLKRVYDFLNIKNLINFGVLPFDKTNFIDSDSNVIIIGAGISSLTAARQIRSFGVKVTILEARDVIGGRMQDDTSLGVAVGKGAQLITGTFNNPLVVALNQLNIPSKHLTDYCPLLDSVKGNEIKRYDDKISEEHYSCILDAVKAWTKVTKKDSPLNDVMMAMHITFKEKSSFVWRSQYERLVHWHTGNIEFSCGARIENVSALNWDQNEAASQFAGSHSLLTEGSRKLIEKLAEGTEIHLKHAVKEITYEKNKPIVVKCKNGKSFTADKVIMAIPLAVYQKENIKFNPPLPSTKTRAYKSLGAGLIEKVAVKFKTRFWAKLLKEDGQLNYFGCVPSGERDRGLFNMFYDFSKISDESSSENCYVLMSYVCGKSVEVVNMYDDKTVVNMFVGKLETMFPELSIPEPIGHVVTHWGRDEYIGMSYSYVKVDGRGEDYDLLAQPIDDRIFFAGECCNRYYPQTMTGAMITGLREAGNVIRSCLRDG
uniref:SWIRM domain-containing protein n=1 Tax=Rhabditophanes sp. KR3021 TaxID=114890 RepID=A0AC35UDX6_9BILA